MERSLAHIEQITELCPIAGADKIEVARILGWECVVKKGEFSVGEKVIYVEVDSVMPDTKEFEFLRERKFKVRTIKLRGQVSQGLVLSLKSLPVEYSFKQDWKLGEDVTEILKITKYLTPSEQEEINQLESKLRNDKNKLRKFLMRYAWFRNLILSRKAAGFPGWISKTDEVRGQNLKWDEFYEQYKDAIVYVTEKVDYQSVTFTGKLIPRFNLKIFKKFLK